MNAVLINPLSPAAFNRSRYTCASPPQHSPLNFHRTISFTMLDHLSIREIAQQHPDRLATLDADQGAKAGKTVTIQQDFS